MTEVYRGFPIYYTPPPERVWSFRPAPDAPLESHRSAFQARRAINELLDGESEPTPRRSSAALSKSLATYAGNSSVEYGSLWSDDELRLAIDAYDALLEADGAGTRGSRSDEVRQLSQAMGRTKTSVLRRLQNISYERERLGLQLLPGYHPMPHSRKRLRELIGERQSDVRH